jgi:hypothetical protein
MYWYLSRANETLAKELSIAKIAMYWYLSRANETLVKELSIQYSYAHKPGRAHDNVYINHADHAKDNWQNHSASDTTVGKYVLNLWNWKLEFNLQNNTN